MHEKKMFPREKFIKWGIFKEENVCKKTVHKGESLKERDIFKIRVVKGEPGILNEQDQCKGFHHYFKSINELPPPTSLPSS